MVMVKPRILRTVGLRRGPTATGKSNRRHAGTGGPRWTVASAAYISLRCGAEGSSSVLRLASVPSPGALPQSHQSG